MEVREATTDDVAAIRDIARESWHATYDDVIGPEAVDEQLGEWYDRRTVEAGVTREDGSYLVAERDGRVVGYASGYPIDEGPADAVLAAIYVRPDHWRSGVGSAMFEALLQELRAAGCEDVWLAVLAENDAARSFYERHRCEVRGRETADIGGVEAEELIMVRSL